MIFKMECKFYTIERIYFLKIQFAHKLYKRRDVYIYVWLFISYDIKNTLCYKFMYIIVILLWFDTIVYWYK